MVSSSAIPIFRYCSVVPIVFSNRQKATDVASLDVGQEHDSRCTVQLFDDMFITSTLKSFAELWYCFEVFTLQMAASLLLKQSF